MPTKKKTRRVVRKSTTGGVTTTSILTWFREFVGLKEQTKQLSAREKEVKGRLMEAVEARGFEDSDGHWWFDLPEPIGGFSKLKREKRESKTLNHERAMELIEKKGLEKSCIKYVPVVDEDALTAANFSKQISDQEFNSLIDRNVTWAFVPRK